MKRLILGLLVFAAAVGVQAQSTTPPEELKKLEWLVGEWTGNMAMEMEGQKFDSKQTMKAEWDGQFLRLTTIMDMMGMKMTETMFVGYDAKSKKYVAHAFTNFSPDPRIERGGFEGNKFVMVSDPWMVGGSPEPTTGRGSMWLDGKTVRTTLEFKMSDKWTPVGTGSYTKKGG